MLYPSLCSFHKCVQSERPPSGYSVFCLTHTHTHTLVRLLLGLSYMVGVELIFWQRRKQKIKKYIRKTAIGAPRNAANGQLLKVTQLYDVADLKFN